MPDGDSFLPRIQSVFYAVFDVRQGPKIEYQVPEGLISITTSGTSAGNAAASPLATPSSLSSEPDPESRNSSTSLVSPTSQRTSSRPLQSPQKRSASSSRPIFHFDDVSKYVIPPSALCGRLVTCATRNHRVIGFPVALHGKYQRNYFRYNLCFVFERTADLSCYEPIIRKISRVLTSCEEESAFLSSPDTSPAVHAILEQLYEDLNSYSETSIPIDRFNSIELKIFPFYPNPPSVKDWMVPLALINISKRVESNWDLTMVKVCKHIDGVNHVSRIAHLADCELELTRQAISHLLYYQVIMTIDIFQYSNMYTLRKSIQWLGDEPNVREECGLYVAKPGHAVVDWPKLLHLYSRMKPGKTIKDWMDAHNVNELGIDVRRFASFGVIKGFLRRVHRWPVLLQDQNLNSPDSPYNRGRVRADSLNMSTSLTDSPVQTLGPQVPRLLRHRNSDAAQPTSATDTVQPQGHFAQSQHGLNSARPRRKVSAAEQVLEQLRTRGSSAYLATATPQTAIPREEQERRRMRGMTGSRRQSLVSTNLTLPTASPTLQSGQYNSRPTQAPSTAPIVTRPRLSPSTSTVNANHLVSPVASAGPYPPELAHFLNGEHHTDELATKFEVGWPRLEQWLIAIGGGQGDGDFGRVAIIFR